MGAGSNRVALRVQSLCAYSFLVTIKLFDIEAQKRFEQEVETYDLRIKDRMDNPGSMAELPAYPKTPEPFADSRDPSLTKSTGNGCVPCSPLGGGGGDLRSLDEREMDGTSQSEVKGFESRQNADADVGLPFSIKK
jgi:hypothetical protein